MPDNKTLIEDLNYLSSQISTIVRTLNFGILVFIWSLLYTSVTDLKEVIESNYIILIWIAIIVIFSLLFDFLQYVVAFLNTRKLQEKIETENNIKSLKFNTDDFLYKLRNFFFIWKQILTVFSVIGLLIILGIIVF